MASAPREQVPAELVPVWQRAPRWALASGWGRLAAAGSAGRPRWAVGGAVEAAGRVQRSPARMRRVSCCLPTPEGKG